MAEYIERVQAKWAVDFAIELSSGDYDKVCEKINNIPAADVAPVVHGRWIILRDNYGDPEGERCSVCGTEYATDYDGEPVLSNYCPNCGAKMDLKE